MSLVTFQNNPGRKKVTTAQKVLEKQKTAAREAMEK
jgi:hypothetical protein